MRMDSCRRELFSCMICTTMRCTKTQNAIGTKNGSKPPAAKNPNPSYKRINSAQNSHAGINTFASSHFDFVDSW
jgi:hypothetical protein